MTRERIRRLRHVLDRRQPDLTVLLDNVHKPHNLSAILRSCDAVGVLEAHAVWPDASLRRLRSSGAIAGGSDKWTPVQTHPSIDAAIATLRTQGVEILAAHLSETAVDFRDVDYTRPVCFLMGAELFGVSDRAAALADRCVIIPMQGMVASLNVSVAAATLLFEAQRQRLAAGLYDRPRLAPEVYERRLFEWAWPRVAAHCRRTGVAYPALDAEGDVVGNAAVADACR